MSKPTELTTFTFQLDQLLRGEAIPHETPELAFARRLRAVDLASRSRSETSLRARLLSSKNSPTFPPTPMNSPHQNSHPSRLLPSLAFGAAMVLLVLFLAWVLTNTTPQPAVNATETAPVVTPLDSGPEEASTAIPVELPAVTPALPGELYFLLSSTTPPFYYQWAYMPAWCAGLSADCENLQMLSALPGGGAILNTVLSWSPDGSKALFSGYDSDGQAMVVLNPVTGEWRIISVDFFVQQEKYFWTADGQWVAFQAQGEGIYTSYIGLFNPTTGEFRQLNEVPGEERDPFGWLNERELLVQVYKYDPNGGGKQTFPDIRSVRLDVQTGQETEYTEVEGPGPRVWDGNAFLSPNGQWFAVSLSEGGVQTEIVLMRPDGSESHSVFKASGGLNGSVIWLNDEYLFVRLYSQTADKNILYLISLTDNTAQEIFLPGLDTSAFDVAQVSFRPNADPPFGGASVGQFPSPTPYPTHAPTTGDPLTVLQTLTAQYANDILSGSGWLHITKRIYVNGDSGALPNPWLADDWYLLDDQKQVVQAVSIQADENGTPIQVKVFRDRQWVHLTQGTTSPADPFMPNLDSDFVVEAMNAIANGSTLQMSDLYFDGQFVGIRFSYLEDDVEVEGIFDENTGQMLSFTGTFIEDQEKQIIYSISVITQERTTLPPANILAYLDQDSVPYVPLPPTGTPALNPDGTYTVQDGDTLSQIASDFGLTVETLIALNSLSLEAPAIFPGMVLIVVPFDPANLRFPAQATVNGLYGEFSNLRTGSGTEYEVIGDLTEGTPVTVLAATEGFDWYQIVYEASADGTAWVYGPSLTFQPQPPPGLAQSDLTFEWTFTGNPNQPNAWADIYAGEQYLGQVDFGVTLPGATPGGWCVRSFDGAWLAFAYHFDVLHWFSVENISQVYELPDFVSVMSLAFSPTDNRLAFSGCSNDGCALWLLSPITGEIQKLYSQMNTNSAPPLWSPDGKYLAFLPTEANPVDAGATPANIIVLQVDNGAVIYEGYAYTAESPLIAWGTPLPDFSDVEGTTGCESAP